jgi:hypothetical protein
MRFQGLTTIIVLLILLFMFFTGLQTVQVIRSIEREHIIAAPIPE